MCGRFLLTSPGTVLKEAFGLSEAVPWQPRYNLAPGQQVPIIRQEPDGKRAFVLVRWGLVPPWAEDPALGNRLINARAETVILKPSFRDAFRKRRCLVPANGYYEWKQVGPRKQPYLFRLREGKPFAIAGLWSRWQPEPDRPALETCALITTEPNPIAAQVHSRMPAILLPEQYAVWLSPDTDPKRALAFLQPFEGEELESYPVSLLVNSPTRDGPELLWPLAEDPLQESGGTDFGSIPTKT